MKIPTVKTWIITDVDGVRFTVFGPTKRLAMMNFRHQYGYSPIVETIGLKRKKAVSA